MIEINLGNIGSGKTASVVRDLVMNEDERVTYSNIITKNVPNNIIIDKEMIIKEETYTNAKDKTDSRLVLNKEFWQKASKKHGTLNVLIDECHHIFSSRKSMTKENQIFSEWIAMLRRVLGGSADGYGKLILITQLERRIDVIAREMCTKVRFHKCTFVRECKNCGYQRTENNETADKMERCYQCAKAKFKIHSHVIEVFVFRTMEDFEQFRDFQYQTFYDHYVITDIEKIFSRYDTMQWDNLLST